MASSGDAWVTIPPGPFATVVSDATRPRVAKRPLPRGGLSASLAASPGSEGPAKKLGGQSAWRAEQEGADGLPEPCDASAGSAGGLPDRRPRRGNSQQVAAMERDCEDDEIECIDADFQGHDSFLEPSEPDASYPSKGIAGEVVFPSMLRQGSALLDPVTPVRPTQPRSARLGELRVDGDDSANRPHPLLQARLALSAGDPQGACELLTRALELEGGGAEEEEEEEEEDEEATGEVNRDVELGEEAASRGEALAEGTAARGVSSLALPFLDFQSDLSRSPGLAGDACLVDTFYPHDVVVCADAIAYDAPSAPHDEAPVFSPLFPVAWPSVVRSPPTQRPLPSRRVRLLIARSEALLGLGKTVDALSDALEAAALSPLASVAWGCLGAAQRGAGHPRAAAAAFARAAALAESAEALAEDWVLVDGDSRDAWEGEGCCTSGDIERSAGGDVPPGTAIASRVGRLRVRTGREGRGAALPAVPSRMGAAAAPSRPSRRAPIATAAMARRAAQWRALEIAAQREASAFGGEDRRKVFEEEDEV